MLILASETACVSPVGFLCVGVLSRCELFPFGLDLMFPLQTAVSGGPLTAVSLAAGCPPTQSLFGFSVFFLFGFFSWPSQPETREARLRHLFPQQATTSCLVLLKISLLAGWKYLAQVAPWKNLTFGQDWA